jgi:hypothetical protein
MRADDDRDPLDSWLNQQVKPLPPPPGTFELITRRARGRKLRKLAVTVVSAAAVAAAVAIAVPIGLNLHLTQPPSNGRLSAEASSTTPAQESPSARTAAPIKSPSPTPSATRSAVEPSGGEVPPNFQPSSVTFVSTNVGWVIGQAGTPGKCANADPYICTSIARTENGGQSWRGGPAPDTGAPKGASGVSGIRFLNGTYGWAFGPELWATDDGGNTWNQVSTGGMRVTDLETSNGQAYALFATCTTQTSSFAQDCTSYTLMTTTAGSNDWKPVGAATSGLTNGGAATSSVLALTGSNGYLLAPDGTLYSGPIGGTWSRVSTALCKPGAAQADGLPGSALLALENSTTLDIACDGTSATAPPSVYTSGNSGASWTQQPAAAWSGVSLGSFGISTSLAAAPNGTLTLATTDGIYYQSAGNAQWQASNATGSQAPSGGFSYVGMTTDEQGIALPADLSLHQIWMTTDGGATWQPAASVAPGN